jgi:hypothetical protein
MDLFNTDIRWQSGYNIFFLGKIFGQDIEHLSKWTHGRTLSISLKTSGLAKVDESIVVFDLKLNHNQLKLGLEEFESNFLKNTGLNYSYTREFEVNSPVISNLSTKPALDELYILTCSLQNNLEHALRILRLSEDPLQTLVMIRQPLDSIKALKKNARNIANDLYITTKIVENLNPSTPGAELAAEQLVNDLFQIFEVLFDFSSKAFHTKNKSSNQTYKMTPRNVDAEFSLTLALTITNYLIHRIKVSCQ